MFRKMESKILCLRLLNTALGLFSGSKMSAVYGVIDGKNLKKGIKN